MVILLLLEGSKKYRICWDIDFCVFLYAGRVIKRVRLDVTPYYVLISKVYWRNRKKHPQRVIYLFAFYIDLAHLLFPETKRHRRVIVSSEYGYLMVQNLFCALPIGPESKLHLFPLQIAQFHSRLSGLFLRLESPWLHFASAFHCDHIVEKKR